ncbi:hypothetical protein F5144DRAFT_205470 [Chaetomium tenue]|uniref:Uncharacterized protein n=1 Tax=Chaetomium tenue TaxID=1854479 RepID=A0ACB7PFH7_9PEZI|nr:hypothetical protein F5144DRAFT_205470 [Chaetomium globosum]
MQRYSCQLNPQTVPLQPAPHLTWSVVGCTEAQSGSGFSAARPQIHRRHRSPFRPSKLFRGTIAAEIAASLALKPHHGASSTWGTAILPLLLLRMGVCKKRGRGYAGTVVDASRRNAQMPANAGSRNCPALAHGFSPPKHWPTSTDTSGANPS